MAWVGGDFQRSPPTSSICDSVKWDMSAADFDVPTAHSCPQELLFGLCMVSRRPAGYLKVFYRRYLKAVLQDELQGRTVREHILGLVSQKGGNLMGTEVWGLKTKGAVVF